MYIYIDIMCTHAHTHIYIYIYAYYLETIELHMFCKLSFFWVIHTLFIRGDMAHFALPTTCMVTWPRRLPSKVIQSRRRSVPRRHAWIWTMLKQPVTELGRYYKCLPLKFVSWEEHFASLGTHSMHSRSRGDGRIRAQEMRFDNLTLSCR